MTRPVTLSWLSAFCDPRAADAYAQRPDPKELWVGIIEKAFAAWKGGYGALDGGVPSDALTALTGRPTETAAKTSSRTPVAAPTRWCSSPRTSRR